MDGVSARGGGPSRPNPNGGPRAQKGLLSARRSTSTIVDEVI